MTLIWLIFFFFFLLSPLVPWGWFAFSLFRFLKYRSFPCTDGVLTKRESVIVVDPARDNTDGPPGGRIEVEYAYRANGREFLSTRHHSMWPTYVVASSVAKVRAKLDLSHPDLQVGSPVKVSYDPRNPSFSFLANGRIGNDIILPLVVGFLFAIFFWPMAWQIFAAQIKGGI